MPTDDSVNLIKIYRGSNIESEMTGKYGTNYLAKEHLNQKSWRPFHLRIMNSLGYNIKALNRPKS